MEPSVWLCANGLPCLGMGKNPLVGCEWLAICHADLTTTATTVTAIGGGEEGAIDTRLCAAHWQRDDDARRQDGFNVFHGMQILT